jgi:hypothetical protein
VTLLLGPLLNHSRMNSLIWQDEIVNIYLAGGVKRYDHACRKICLCITESIEL